MDETRRPSATIRRLQQPLPNRPSSPLKLEARRPLAPIVNPVAGAPVPSDAVAAGRRGAALPDPADATTARRGPARDGARQKIAIRYRGGSKSAPPDRVVHPCAQVVASDLCDALAYCESRIGIRSFRLDCIEHLDETADSYESPAQRGTLGVPAERPLDPASKDSSSARCAGTRLGMTRGLKRRSRSISTATTGRSCARASRLDHALADPQWGVRHLRHNGPRRVGLGGTTPDTAVSAGHAAKDRATLGRARQCAPRLGKPTDQPACRWTRVIPSVLVERQALGLRCPNAAWRLQPAQRSLT